MKYNFRGGILVSFLRWFLFKVFTFIKNRQAAQPLSERGNFKILLFPAFREHQQFDELIRKISFAFPENDSVSFHLSAKENKLNEALSNAQKLAANTSHQLRSFKVHFIPQKEPIRLKHYDLILCHKALALPRLVRYFHKTEIIDPDFYSYTESITFQRIWFQLLDDGRRAEYRKLSEINFSKLSARLSGKGSAYCFLTGPSIGNFRDFIIPDNCIRIICNSMVRNDEFLEYIGGADIITFADPVFHFGASDYAIKFREKMLEVALKWDSFIVVPDMVVPLLTAWFPSLKERIIGIETVQGDFHLPSAGSLWVKATDNIFTMFMLPLAATFAAKIFVGGADGRDKNESYFWKFSADAQFNEEMQSAFNAHPSFFRDRKYLNYYREHCKTVEELINYLEHAGKTVSSITPSQIPVLAKRLK